MEMTDQDIDIAGTEADESFWQRHESLPEGHDPTRTPSGAVGEPEPADDAPRRDPAAPDQARDLK